VKQYRSLALALGMMGGLVGMVPTSASAQAAEAVAVSGAQALSVPPPPEALRDDTGGELDPTPMNSAGIGVKVGMAGMSAGEQQLRIEGKNVESRIEARRGVYVALPISLGGDGFGWSFEPYFARASVERTTRDALGAATGSTEASLTSYGLYTGPMFNVHVVQPLYLGVGVGLKAAYVHSPSFEYALDAYARVPLSATYYLSNKLALVAELGLGYGLSAYVDKPTKVIGANGKVSAVESEAQVGKGLTWDCSIGVRLP
jgi:hypothetical protein